MDEDLDSDKKKKELNTNAKTDKDHYPPTDFISPVGSLEQPSCFSSGEKQPAPSQSKNESVDKLMDLIQWKTAEHIAGIFSNHPSSTTSKRKPMYNQSTAGKSYKYLRDMNQVKDWEH